MTRILTLGALAVGLAAGPLSTAFAASEPGEGVVCHLIDGEHHVLLTRVKPGPDGPFVLQNAQLGWDESNKLYSVTDKNTKVVTRTYATRYKVDDHEAWIYCTVGKPR